MSQPPPKLEYVLGNPFLRNVFHQFASEEHSSETLEFWVKVEEFRKIQDGEQFGKAQEIYDTFLDPSAPKEVNVSAFLVKKSKQDLESKSVDKGMFDVLQREVFHLMETDTFKRFLTSALFQKVEKEVLSSESRLARQRSNSIKIRGRAGSTLPLPQLDEKK